MILRHKTHRDFSLLTFQLEKGWRVISSIMQPLASGKKTVLYFWKILRQLLRVARILRELVFIEKYVIRGLIISVQCVSVKTKRFYVSINVKLGEGRAYTIHLFLKLRTSKILPRLNVLIFFQQFEAQNGFILFLTAKYSFMVENRPQRPSGVYVCPVFS